MDTLGGWWVALTTLVSHHPVFFGYSTYADSAASSAASTRVESTLPPLVMPSPSPLSRFHLLLPSPALSLLTCPNTNAQLVVPNTSIGAFLSTYTLTLLTLTLLHQLACLAVAISPVLGEFCILCPFQCITTFLVALQLFSRHCNAVGREEQGYT